MFEASTAGFESFPERVRFPWGRELNPESITAYESN
jgi:hypothetical protein